jgi:hypothetical protein
MPESNLQNGAAYLIGSADLRGDPDAGVMRRLEGVAVGDDALSAVTLSALMYAVTTSGWTEQGRAALDLQLRLVAAAGVSGCGGCEACVDGGGVLLQRWEGWSA